jgi:hypothetical protein
MRLALHITLKDLQRLRWVLVLLLVAIVSQLGLATIQASLDKQGHTYFFMGAWVFGYVFVPVISIGLVMGLQDDDPVVSTSAFWMTRPISGGRLLLAKAIGLGVLCMAPLAVLVPFWVTRGFTGVLLGKAAVRTLTSQGFTALLVVPFAVISANTTRYVVNLVLGALAFAGLFVLHHELSREPQSLSIGVLFSRSMVILALWLAGGVLVASNQYARRRTGVSVAIMATAAALGLVAEERWNIDLTRSPDQVANAGRVDPPVTIVVPAAAGAATVADGYAMKVIGVIPNDPQGVVVEVSESAPSFAGGPVSASRQFRATESEHYLIVSLDDGRRMVAETARDPEELDAANLRYFRTSLVFHPSRDLAGNVPGNIALWLRGAVLIKAFTSDLGTFELQRRATKP